MNNTLLKETLSNLGNIAYRSTKGERDYLAIAKELKISIKGLKKAQAYDVIKEEIERRLTAEKLNKALSHDWIKTSGNYSLNEIERALKVTMNASLNLNTTKESRFDEDDKIKIILADGRKGNITVKNVFNKVVAMNLQYKKEEESVKEEVACTTINSNQARERYLAEYESKVNKAIIDEKKSNEVEELSQKDFYRIYNIISESFVAMRNIDLTDMWLVNEIKKQLHFVYDVESVQARYNMFINVITCSNQMTKEYIKELIVNNFPTDVEYIPGEFDARQRDKYKTWFIELAELIEDNFDLSQYQEDNTQYFSIDGLVNVCYAIYQEAVDIKSAQLIDYGCSIKGKEQSEKQVKFLESVIAGYELETKETFPIDKEIVFKNTITGMGVSYKYEKYRHSLITDKQVVGYLKTLRRQDILSDKSKLAHFTAEMRKRHTRKEFTDIMRVLINNVRLVKLAISYDAKFKGQICEACKYIDSLDTMERISMTRRLESIESKYLMSLHHTSDDRNINK